MEPAKLASDIESTLNTAYEELTGLSDTDAEKRPAEGQWSVKEIIGHMVDSASNNHQRWVRLQMTDGLSFPEYQQDNARWVALQQYNNRPWPSLLALWRHFNLHMAAMVENVDTACLDNLWVIDADTAIPLADLMTGYLVHLNMHLEQIRETLAQVG